MNGFIVFLAAAAGLAATPALAQDGSSSTMSVGDMEAALGVSSVNADSGQGARFRSPTFDLGASSLPAPAEEARKAAGSFSLPIEFDFGSTNIRPNYLQIVANVTEVLRRHPDLRLAIRGHTDAVGTEEANQVLSERRARAVRAALIERGVASARIVAEGRGKRELLPSVDPDSPQNRRVEFVRLGAE
jgi:outer membrane protein OmpA-like peptidoglycan-associated protein